MTDYRSSQPVKWASLARLREDVSAMAQQLGHPITSTLELGCGAATLSLHFAAAGADVTAIDREPAALRLAADCARAVGTPIALHRHDFLEREAPVTADLVFSGGVLEHYAEDELDSAYGRHRNASHRWMLIGVPNYESVIFRTFLQWAERAGRLYEEEHLAIDVVAVAEAHGDHVVWADGCHVVLGSAAYMDPTSHELRTHHAAMRPFVLAAGGPPEFPNVEFAAHHIDVLHRIEREVGSDRRYAHGFMRWWLIERGDVR